MASRIYTDNICRFRQLLCFLSLSFSMDQLVSRPLCGQNGHSPVSRTSSISTTPSESFRQFKVSVTTKYGQLPSQGIPERSLTSLWKAFIPIPPCSSDPFVNFSPHRHLRLKSFPSSEPPVYHRQIGDIGEQGGPI